MQENNETLRATPIELEQRIDFAYRALLRGVEVRRIITVMRKKNWGVSDRQLYNYVKAAQEAAAEEARQINRRTEFKLALSRYTMLYRKCVSKSQWREASMMQDRICTLLGLNSATPLTIDWRAELESQGVNAGELFGRLVEELSEVNGEKAKS